MKLHEIKRLRRATHSTTVTVEPAGGIYGEFDVDVDFDYEGRSSTLHVPGDPTTREHHAAQVDIESIKLAQDVQATDEDGEPTGKVYKKGTDASDLPGWKKSDDDYVLDKVYDEAESDDDDDDPRNEYDPDDRYDSRY